MAVRVTLECGHGATLRQRTTAEGYTHDWEVFVKGVDNADVHHFIDKVVFNLHETFPKPKRVFKEPPYHVKESGYAGFVIPIDIYLKNKDEPKKFTIYYDLQLQTSGSAINSSIKHTETFASPSDDFRKKLLKGGATLLSSADGSERSESKSSGASSLVSKPKLSGEMPSKKQHHYRPAEPRPTNSTFADLFGTPIKTVKISPESAKASKQSKQQLDKGGGVGGGQAKLAEKTSVEKSEKHQKKHGSPSKEGKKEERKDKSRDLLKEANRKEKKRSQSPKVPKKEEREQRKEEKRNEEKDGGSKREDKDKVEKKKEKKREREKEREKKEKHKEERKIEERQQKCAEEKARVEEKKEKKPEKLEKHETHKIKEKREEKKEEKIKEEVVKKVEKEKTRHKHKKKDKKERKENGSKERKEKRQKEEKGSLGNANSAAGTSNPLSALLAEMPENSSDSAQSNDEEIVPKREEPSVHLDIKPPLIVPSPSREKREDKKERRSKPGEESSKKRKRKSSRGDDEVTQVKRENRSNSPLPEPVSSSQSPLNVDSSSAKVKTEQDATKSECEPLEQVTPDSTNGVLVGSEQERSALPVFSEAYVNQLKELQHKIMTLQDNEDLRRVVQVIAETGQYEITKKTFDFDLCTLDRRTVQRLQQFFATT